jgi:NAD-dependent dihydropyrimidine dehydrogenase PreA subunit
MPLPEEAANYHIGLCKRITKEITCVNKERIMAGKKIETETAEAFGRIFVKGNIPEINPVRCLGCGHCAVLCKKLGPNVLEVQDGLAKVIHPENCIGDGACMLACPTKAIFLMSKYNPSSPPNAV